MVQLAYSLSIPPVNLRQAIMDILLAILDVILSSCQQSNCRLPTSGHVPVIGMERSRKSALPMPCGLTCSLSDRLPHCRHVSLVPCNGVLLRGSDIGRGFGRRPVKASMLAVVNAGDRDGFVDVLPIRQPQQTAGQRQGSENLMCTLSNRLLGHPYDKILGPAGRRQEAGRRAPLPNLLPARRRRGSNAPRWPPNSHLPR